MKAEPLRCIMSGLKKFQLTEAETEFVHFAAFNLRRNNPLSEMMTLVLERIYSQKTAFIRDSITSLLKQDIPVTPSAQGSNQRSVTAGAKL